MPSPELTKDSLSLVLRGDFNPAIFSPAWLLGQNLIGIAEYQDSVVDIISRDLAVFRCGWATVNVTGDALQMMTEDSGEFERIRDLVVGTLKALPHTPLGALGINRDVHFAIRSAEGWHAIGDTLAPKEPWAATLALPGMRSLTMWAVRNDRYGGRVQAKVEPSSVVPQSVYVQHNDHYTLNLVDSQPSNRDETTTWGTEESDSGIPSADKLPLAISILTEDLLRSVERSDQVISGIASLGKVQ